MLLRVPPIEQRRFYERQADEAIAAAGYTYRIRVSGI